MVMEKSISSSLPVVRETRFRAAGAVERAGGLWVDRIGCAATDAGMPGALRILGQYAAVAVENGPGRLLTGSRGDWPVEPGDAILLTPDEPAAYGPAAAWYMRWVVWNGPEAAGLAGHLAAGKAPVMRGGAEAVRRAFFALAPLMEGEDVAAALERKAALLELHAALFRAREQCEPGPGVQTRIERVLAHIQGSLGKPLSLAELAGVGGMSVPHFRRLFRRHTGRSPVAFVTAQRVARAKELLLRGLPIKTVAQQVGIPDPFYFMRVFKQTTGRSAGAFVADHRAGV